MNFKTLKSHTMKTVLRIITRLNIGGPSIHTILLSEGLREKFKTFLVVGKEGKEEGSMLEEAKNRNIDIIFIPELQREISPIKDIIAFFKLIGIIRKIKPDIVHTHLSKAGMLGRLCAWLCGVPIIIHTFHGHTLHSYFGRLKTLFFIIIERWLSLISTRIITLTETQRDEILKFGIGNRNKVIVIPLGLSLDRFYDISEKKGILRNELGISDKPLIGTIARLVPIKDIGTFLEASAIVLKEIDVLFVIAGDGYLRKELEKKAKDLGIEKNVLFLGFRKDLDIIYADLNCFVLSSLNEGLPVAIIEAQASGIPVVATDVGGVSTLVSPDTGILVPPKNPEALANAIKIIILDKEKAKEMGEKARENSKKYTDKRLIEDIERLYEGL
ncbi:MAG: glycosyltransferase family 4 protein [bacterium]